jgi:parallel beta-helix repeat protein
MGKNVRGVVLILILVGISTLALNIQPTKASGTVYIRPDGSIDPPSASITRNGNLYTLTADINGSIVIEKNSITLDGANHVIRGIGTTGSSGIDISKRNNVTIKNVRITAFDYGVFLSNCLNNKIMGCMMTSNNCSIILSNSSNYNSIIGNTLSANIWYAIYLEFSSNNNLTGNNIIANNLDGIKLFADSSNNNILGNNITANGNNGLYIRLSSNNILKNNLMSNNKYNLYVDGSILQDFVQDIDISNTVDSKPVYYWVNKHSMTLPITAGYVCLANCTGITVQNLALTKNGQGMLLAYTTNSIITRNNITANYRGITLRQSSNNKFHHNNFLNNTNQVYEYNSTNAWDDGYPSGGNYWNDYNGGDLYSGSSQNQPKRDGIGDYAYSIDSTSYDRYPLMTQFGKPTTIFVPTRYQTIQTAINAANPGDEIFIFSGTYYANIIINKTLSLVGENRTTTIIDGLRIRNVVSVINSNNVLIEGFIIRNSNLSNSYAGISFYNSNNSMITENTIIQNGFGILASNSGYFVISHNNVSFNLYGCKFQQSSKNGAITNNIVASNTHYGLYFDLSNNCLITSNLLKANEYGITITGSTSGSTIYFNNFISNVHQVGGNPVSTQWNDGYPSGGNYWSNYNGVDVHSGRYQNLTGSDGIGDTPYVINATNKDNYPLMSPWTNIEIAKILSSEPVVGRGYSTSINVTVENQGYTTATFNITLYVSSTAIGMKHVTILGCCSSNVTFNWNTTNFVKGNYNISAVATNVLGERNTADNTRSDYWMLVTKVGDFGGGLPPSFFSCDGKADGKDLSLFLLCYKKTAPTNVMYLADLGGGVPPQFYKCDEVIDGKDLSLFLQCYKGLGPY